jgi:type VI secretion system secreted protein VgrG
MPVLSEYSFLFQSQAVAKDTFVVVRFHGEEGLSQLYSYEILLVSDKADLDLESILQTPATLTIKSKNGNLPYHGILASFEQMHQVDSWVFYRAVLRPKLWWLTLTHHNQVFLNKKLDQFLGDVLQDGGLSQGLDFEFKLKDQYPVWDYLCQYSESHFDFVSRWLERDGVYYWFEQNDQGAKMIASDTLISHTPVPGHETFRYAPPTGLDAAVADEVVKSFSLRRTPMPGKLLLKDYNYEKPSLDLTGRAQVAAKGRGEIYIYGEHFLDVGEGNRLAQVRAEEWKCREQTFHGLSTVPAVRPGYVFNLDRHYRGDFNQRYLTTRVTHEGSQERYLLSGLGVKGLAEDDNLFYRNTFECIPSSVQFRPPRLTDKPRIHGSLPAKIDAAGSGQYAELDSQGRYKVILPFDLSGRSGGKASAWVRMMQPYAGPGMGFHAPLHKDTEVLLSFLDGDPDRPVIAGAVPNAETPSPVNDASQSMVKMTTGGGNKFHIEDQEGNQRILLHTPTAGTYVRLGSHNDPSDSGDDDKIDEDGEYGMKWYSTSGLQIQASAENKIIAPGEMSEVVVGLVIENYLGGWMEWVEIFSNETVIGLATSLLIGNEKKWHPVGEKSGGEMLEEYLDEHKTAVDSIKTIVSKQQDIVECLDNYVTQTEINEAKTQVSEELTRVINTKTSVEDVNTRIQQEATRIVDTKLQVLNEYTKIADVESKIAQVESHLGEAKSELREEMSHIVTEVNFITETSVTMSTLIVLM